MTKKDAGRLGGRAAYGERKASAKLNVEKVRRIRADYPRISCADLGEEYGVHPSTIRAVARGKWWKHLND